MNKFICLVLGLQCILVSCGGSGGDTPNTILQRVDVRDTGDLFPYREDSPYAPVLKSCALAETYESSCTLETLPFIIQSTPVFDRDDVMDRLLVTHDWMGERFEALLADAPDSLIPLFGSVTAISIGSTIRPSFYWSLNGAIRLDPAGMWLSTSEKSNVSTERDFRSDFGAELQYWGVGSYRRGDQAAYDFFSLTDESERTLEDIKLPNYALLYHELGHAVDYLPRESVPTLVSSMKTADALFENDHHFLSPGLTSVYPLVSDVLWSLAEVNFQGALASDDQKTFTSAYVGSEMSNDGAMQYYSYNSTREDFATLFEKIMMKREFGVDYHIAFVQQPADPERYLCSELTVGWGVKNRLADPWVLLRARYAVESVYGVQPEFDQYLQDNLGQQTPLQTGVGWCTSLNGEPNSATAIQARSNAVFDPVEFAKLKAQLRIRHH